MKNKITYYLLSAMLIPFMVSCQFDAEAPDMSTDIYTRDNENPPSNITIGELKEKYKELITDASDAYRFELVSEDLYFDGYVCANDISGNLYQSIYVRKGDDVIVIGINDNSLWTTYPVGTHVVVFLHGLYVGAYGNMAKIGTPYTSSTGKKRLGGMPKFKANDAILVVGFNDNAYETQPILIDDGWLKQHQGGDLMHKWSPMLVRAENVQIEGANHRPVFAYYNERDAGNGVNNTVYIDDKPYTLRQSALSDFAGEKIPKGNVNITAILSRYMDTWQLTLRDINDVEVIDDDVPVPQNENNIPTDENQWPSNQ